MSVAVDIRPMPGYLHAALSGDYVADEFNAAVKRILAAAHEHRRTKILADCRGMAGEPSFAERYAMGQFFADLVLQDLTEGRSVGRWIAAVSTPPFAHPERIGIKGLIDRGVKIEVHDTVDAALKWLEL